MWDLSFVWFCKFIKNLMDSILFHLILLGVVLRVSLQCISVGLATQRVKEVEGKNLQLFLLSLHSVLVCTMFFFLRLWIKENLKLLMYIRFQKSRFFNTKSKTNRWNFNYDIYISSSWWWSSEVNSVGIFSVKLRAKQSYTYMLKCK